MTSRSRFIGGSDAAVALGISHWRSRYMLWCEKTGVEVAKDLSEVEWVYWGTKLEPFVVAEFSRRTGLQCKRTTSMVRHPQHRFIAGHVDRLIPRQATFLECKTSNAFDYRLWGPEEAGEAGVPDYYVAQCDHYMMILDAAFCYLAVLIGGNQFRLYKIMRSAAREQKLLAAELEFWDLVKRNEPPPISSEKDAKHRWRSLLQGSSVEVDQAVRQKIVRLSRVAELRSEHEKEEKALRNELFPVFSDKEYLSQDGEALARLSLYGRSQFHLDDFRKQHPKLAEQFTTSEQSKRLKILI